MVHTNFTTWPGGRSDDFEPSSLNACPNGTVAGATSTAVGLRSSRTTISTVTGSDSRPSSSTTTSWNVCWPFGSGAASVASTLTKDSVVVTSVPIVNVAMSSSNGTAGE